MELQIRYFKYRIYPSKKQILRFNNCFCICKEVYNTLLDFHNRIGVSHRFDFNKIIRDIKITCPDVYYKVNGSALQNVGDRLSKSLDDFFRRCKSGRNKKGFPRFKSKINSVTYPQPFDGKGRRCNFWFISDKRVHIAKIGNVPIKLHRIPKGKIKTMTIKRNNANQWHAIFTCETPLVKITHRHPYNVVGIDVGLENFITTNNGAFIKNPRLLSKAERRLSKLHRINSKKIVGSKNREKSRIKVARAYLKVCNQRVDFLHKIAHSLTTEYGIIAGEKLNIKNMIKGNSLVKNILDASWGRFYKVLEYKAVTSGSTILKNPKTNGSSKRCSNCGAIFYMPLSKRKFSCTKCGFSCHRDVNASINHVNDTRGLREIHTPVDIGPPQQPCVAASSVNEAGTTHRV